MSSRCIGVLVRCRVVWLLLGGPSAACQLDRSSQEERPPAEVDRDSARTGVLPAAASTALARSKRAGLDASKLSRNARSGRPVRPKPSSASHFRRLTLGDGWGCAAHTDNAYSCWSAARGISGEKMVARRVPWLDGKSIFVGPDRLCVRERAGLRCWRAPDFMLNEPAGGTAPPTATSSWFVFIDPSFDSNFLRDRTPVTHGTRSGCAGGLCWGAADPSASSPACEVGPMLLPCALRDERTFLDFWHTDADNWKEAPIVGDMFACKARRDHGLLCVGVSRDGWFGSADDCPPELSTNWPTPPGEEPIAAPHARCARTPVLVSKDEHSGVFASASASGMCLTRLSHPYSGPACFGEIRPAREGLTDVAVGLSQRPSACGTDERGELYCWGAGYSRDAAAVVPVRIEPGRVISSVAWDAPGRFHEDCQIHRNCGRTSQALPACPAVSTTLTPSELLALADGLEGTRVKIRGTLLVEPTWWSGGVAIACGPFAKTGKPVPILERGGGYNDFCCPAHGDAPVILTNGQHQLILEGSWCTGDSSRTCCSMPILGQTVIASGTLAWRDSAVERSAGWILRDPRLCEPSSTHRLAAGARTASKWFEADDSN